MRKKTLKLGVAAVSVALLIIVATVVIGNPAAVNKSTNRSSPPASNYLVMLTDPPNVPQGTTQLNLTYSGLSLHVEFSNGTSSWVPVNASGTVNLLELVNVTKTIAAASLPTGTEVQIVKFDIASVSATINGSVYSVTPLHNQITAPIHNAEATRQTISGTLLELSPTLVQIHGTDSNGTATNYYALVPSATAIHRSDVGRNSSHVGDETRLDSSDADELAHASGNVTITAATLSASGNSTTLLLTIKNIGTENATLSGLVLQGEFNSSYACQAVSTSSSTSTNTATTSTTSTTSSSSVTDGRSGDHDSSQSSTATTTSIADESHGGGTHGLSHNDKGACGRSDEGAGNRNAIPFSVNGTKLVPLFAEDSHDEGASSITVKPGETVTISFTGMIVMHHESDEHSNGWSGPTIMPISGNTYTIHLTGEGNQKYQVTAA